MYANLYLLLLELLNIYDVRKPLSALLELLNIYDVRIPLSAAARVAEYL